MNKFLEAISNLKVNGLVCRNEWAYENHAGLHMCPLTQLAVKEDYVTTDQITKILNNPELFDTVGSTVVEAIEKNMPESSEFLSDFWMAWDHYSTGFSPEHFQMFVADFVEEHKNVQG